MSFPQDSEHDDADTEAGRKPAMPLLTLWGSAGLPAQLPIHDIWREYAEDVTRAEIPECRHFPARGAARRQCSAHLREFLAPAA